MNPAIQRIKSRKFLRLATTLSLGLVSAAPLADAATGSYSSTLTSAQSFNWSAIAWSGSTPNAAGDIANFTFSGDLNVTLNTNVTLARLSAIGTGQFNLLRGTGTNAGVLTMDNGTGLASVLFTRNSADATGRRIDANIVLNSDTIVTWGRIQGGARTHGLRGILSGAGRVSLNYAIAPTEGPDTGTPINLNGGSHVVSLGTASDAVNTHTGGTDLRAGSSTFTTVKFQTFKTDALGTGTTAGRLFMHQSALDMSTFNQTAGGLSGGTGSAKISSGSTTAGTTTLTLTFADTANGGTPYTYAGAILDGSASGMTGAIRTVALTKSGTGTQILSGTNQYTGSTIISAGTLQFAKQASLYNNGAAASWTTAGRIQVSSGATLAVNAGGTGEFTSSDIDTLQGLGGLASGARLGIDTTNAGGGEFIHSGNIGGGIGLTKLGTGKLTLDGTNTYTGTTLVNAGTLAIGATGTLSGTSNINLTSGTTFDVSAAGFTLGAGQTITGNGSVVGTLVSNGTLAAGNSIGTLNFTDLTVNGALNVELDGFNLSDLYNATGLLTIGNGATLNFSTLGTLTGNAYIFAKYGSWNGQQFTTINGTPSGWTVNYNYNDGSSTNNFALVAVPEPGAIALSMLGGLLLFGRRRR